MGWDIRREGRAWSGNALDRYELAPGKIELIYGKLFCTDEERLTMLALLLENVGADAAVRLGDPDVWRSAVAGLREEDEAGNVCAVAEQIRSGRSRAARGGTRVGWTPGHG